MLKRWDNLPEFMRNDAVRPYWDVLDKKRGQLILKRLFDLVIALILLIILLIPMLIIAVAIKVDSSGPVFYRQERVTTYGKHFKIHKFRTMVSNADKIGTAVTVGNDSRITRVGSKLRRVRLDELPQVIDVLQGTMSFVGTRPEAVKYVEKYKPEYNATLLLPAGITSECSIRYKDEDKLLDGASDVDKVYMDQVLPGKMKWNLISFLQQSVEVLRRYTMNIVLLSGGSGKRLWPLSNDVRSKQFIKIFKNDNQYESMVQRVYRQIKAVDPDATVTIATSKSQVSAIHNQVGLDVGISVEPCRRDTFPAIALAVAYLHDVKHVPADESVVICPVDPFVDASYFQCIGNLYEAAQIGKEKLVLMGIEPTYPSEKYGYIKPTQNPDGTWGFTFTEKPTEEKAKEYITAGALWNGGVFAFKLSYVLDKSKELLGTSDYQELFDNYADLKKISFDYAVVEQETSIEVLRYSGTWKDIGTWNALADAMEENVVGNGTIGEGENVHVVNELDIPVLAMGLKDVVIAASPDGILVSSEAAADRIKPYVDHIDQQIMYAEKSWGSYQVIDVEDESISIKVTLNPGNKMNYHSHERRNEIWNIISGSGKAIVDGVEQIIGPGDVIRMQAGQKHMVVAGDDKLQLIEVQLGRDITVADKKKYESP